MHMPLSRAFPVLAAFATAAAVHAQTTLYVDASAPPGGNGQSWQTAFRDLQDALAAVTPQDFYAEIRVAQGIYTPDRGTLNRDMAFSLGSTVSLYGGYAGLLSANPNQRDPDRFVSVLSGDLSRNDGPNFQNYEDNSRQIVRTANNLFGYVDGFTISGGHADVRAVSNSGGVLGTPAGCFPCDARFVVRNCKIIDNLNSTGGDRPLLGGFAVTLENSLIAGNRYDSFLSLESGIVVGAVVNIDRSRILSNRVYLGTIVQAGLTDSTLRSHSITSSVLASNWGAAIKFAGNNISRISNCTIVDNLSQSKPAIDASYNYTTRVTLVNTIVYGNRQRYRPESPQIVADYQGTFVDFYSSNNLIERGAADVRSPFDPFSFQAPALTGDPKLRASAGLDGDPLTWQDNDYRLRLDSPCIDAGDSRPFGPSGLNDVTGAPPYDVRTRAGDSARGPILYQDIGAYELTFCPGDVNASGQVNVQDVLDYVTAFLGGYVTADWNYDSRITPQDLFDFLTAWFQGC